MDISFSSFRELARGRIAGLHAKCRFSVCLLYFEPRDAMSHQEIQESDKFRGLALVQDLRKGQLVQNRQVPWGSPMFSRPKRREQDLSTWDSSFLII